MKFNKFLDKSFLMVEISSPEYNGPEKDRDTLKDYIETIRDFVQRKNISTTDLAIITEHVTMFLKNKNIKHDLSESKTKCDRNGDFFGIIKIIMATDVRGRFVNAIFRLTSKGTEVMTEYLVDYEVWDSLNSD